MTRAETAEAADDLEQAAGCFRAALAVWRGVALTGVTAGTLQQVDVPRLEERRLAVLEECIEVELGLGRHAKLVGELTGLVAEHPVRERLHGQLMLALYRCGRQADALEVYRGLRRMLTSGLGLEPSAALRRLERAILDANPALDMPAGPRPHGCGRAGCRFALPH